MSQQNKSDDVFCKIIDGELPSQKVWEDQLCVAFRDINPIAPTHILVVPRKHITSLKDAEESDKELLGHLLFVAKEIAEKEGLTENGYRVVINSGEWGGQSVFHLHLHLLGGRKLNWRIG